MNRQGRRSSPAGRAATMRLVSLLLQYPDADLLAARPQLATVVRALPRSPARQRLGDFTAWYAGTAETDLAAHYVQTFDLRRKCSLYLTYYLHGDTRRRGLALLALKQRYRAAGLLPPAGELPDYLPVICEFAAIAGLVDGEAPLRQHRQGLELIRAGLREVGSPYQLVLDALCAMLPGLPAPEADLVTGVALAGPPVEVVGLAPSPPPGSPPPGGMRRQAAGLPGYAAAIRDAGREVHR